MDNSVERLIAKYRDNPRLLIYLIIAFVLGVIAGCFVVMLVFGAVLKYSIDLTP
jgi:hypothetical protein